MVASGESRISSDLFCQAIENLGLNSSKGHDVCGNHRVDGLNLTRPTHQQNDDFYVQCSVKKVCKLIIDNGSCENIVSRALMNCLKFFIEPYPNPYNNY